MNKVEMFWNCNLFVLEREIKEFAKKHEIIDISISHSPNMGMVVAVLYKA